MPKPATKSKANSRFEKITKAFKRARRLRALLNSARRNKRAANKTSDTHLKRLGLIHPHRQYLEMKLIALPKTRENKKETERLKRQITELDKMIEPDRLGFAFGEIKSKRWEKIEQARRKTRSSQPIKLIRAFLAGPKLVQRHRRFRATARKIERKRRLKGTVKAE